MNNRNQNAGVRSALYPQYVQNRGGTAPGPLRAEGYAVPPPKSSHKYAVQVMNLHKTSLKSAGWRNNGAQRTTPKVRQQEQKPVYSAMDGRPPTRQKSPSQNLGLELPPRPITPPETEDLFERTWSHSLSTELGDVPQISNRRKTRGKETYKPSAMRPITVNAWDEEQKNMPLSKQRPNSGAKNADLDAIYGKRASTGRMKNPSKPIRRPKALPGFELRNRYN